MFPELSLHQALAGTPQVNQVFLLTHTWPWGGVTAQLQGKLHVTWPR